MANANGSGIHKRRLLRRAALVLGVALLAYGGGSFMAIREAKDTERRADLFLQDFAKLEPEASTMEQVKAIVDKYGAAWHNASYRRDEDRGGVLLESHRPLSGLRGTQFEFTFSNRWLARLHLAPSATFSGDVFVAGGRVVFRTIGFSSGRDGTYFVAHVAENVETKLGDKGYSMLLTPSKTLIDLTPSASRSLKELAYGFNLTCLSRIGGCKDAREVLPGIYVSARERDPGHWIFMADGTQTPSEECAGTISGRVFFFGSRRWPNAPVYLLDLEQSAPLRQLVRKTSRRLRSLGAGAPSTHDVAAEFYNKVAGLVPKLPRISKVRADKVGAYEFGNVATGKRYYLVAMDVGEDGVFYAAAETPLLHPRQQLKLDIREINLWYAE